MGTSVPTNAANGFARHFTASPVLNLGVVMTGVGRRLLGLCLPPLVFCTFDAGITLFGQSAVYWAGQFRYVREGSPTPSHLLQLHPIAFAMGILLWEILFVTIILLLPDVLALIVSIVVTFGHVWGASTWLYFFRFQYAYQCCMGLFLASSIIIGSGIYWGWQARPVQKHPLSSWSPVLRWTLIALAVGIAVYLFLWPRTP